MPHLPHNTSNTQPTTKHKAFNSKLLRLVRVCVDFFKKSGVVLLKVLLPRLYIERLERSTMQCHLNRRYHADIPAVQNLFQWEQSIVRSTGPNTRRLSGLLTAADTIARGGRHPDNFSRRTPCVRSAGRTADTRKPR